MAFNHFTYLYTVDSKKKKKQLKLKTGPEIFLTGNITDSFDCRASSNT